MNSISLVLGITTPRVLSMSEDGVTKALNASGMSSSPTWGKMNKDPAKARQCANKIGHLKSYNARLVYIPRAPPGSAVQAFSRRHCAFGDLEAGGTGECGLHSERYF